MDTAGLAGDLCTRINWDLFKNTGSTFVDYFYFISLLFSTTTDDIVVCKVNNVFFRPHYIFLKDWWYYKNQPLPFGYFLPRFAGSGSKVGL